MKHRQGMAFGAFGLMGKGHWCGEKADCLMIFGAGPGYCILYYRGKG